MLLSRILVYPIKSMDGVAVKEARLTPGGILEFDRSYAIVDESGAFVNAKRTPRIQQLRTTFADNFEEGCFWIVDDPSRHQFSLREPESLNRWLSDYFGFAVKLITEPNSGFPDDRKAFGPTITSESSLRTVSEWFPGIDGESVRRRFRSNLEISEVPPFWEDHLFGAPDVLKPFSIGDVQFLGHNPCQRCVVPTRVSGSRRPDGPFPEKLHGIPPPESPALVQRRALQPLLPFRNQHLRPSVRGR
jgi:uncharacterized protein YcbX